MALNATSHEVQLVCQQQHALAVGQQLPVSFHGGKTAVKPYPRLFADQPHAGGQVCGG